MKNISKSVSILLALIIIGAVGVVAQGNGNPLRQTIQSNGQLTTFMQLVNSADLASMYEANGPYTVLAPSDAAYAELSATELNALKSSPGYARQSVLYHTIQGNYSLEEIGKLGLTATSLGKNVKVGWSGGKLMVNDSAAVTVKDLKASNGTVYIIDTVLMTYGAIAQTEPVVSAAPAAGAAGAPGATQAVAEEPAAPGVGELLGEYNLGSAEYNPAFKGLGHMPYWQGVQRESHSCKGMSFTVFNQKNGVTRVGADRETNPYRGDTQCSEHLPMLCFKQTGHGSPDPNYRAMWGYGEIKATNYIMGSALTSRADADGMCAYQFGEGWRMAEFHEANMGKATGPGSGWEFAGHGMLPLGKRFWVAINDQPANPWNSVQDRSVTYYGTSKMVMERRDNPAIAGGDRMLEWEGRSAGRQWVKGMTWTVLRQHDGLVRVGADASTNPYVGDRSGSEVFPILCVRVTGEAAPASNAAYGSDFANGWSGAEVKTTYPVSGKDIANDRMAGTNLCRSLYGEAWRMASFHDGSLGTHGTDGWHIWARGNLQTGTRFWVAIHDQGANPWDAVHR